MYTIRLGIPEMEFFWNRLVKRNHSGEATKDEQKLYKKLGKAFLQLANDPRYPSLHSHEIEALTRRYSTKVWESYLENHTSGAERIFWVYGPGKNDITIIGLEPHPNDKSNAYQKIILSSMGDVIQP